MMQATIIKIVIQIQELIESTQKYYTCVIRKPSFCLSLTFPSFSRNGASRFC